MAWRWEKFTVEVRGRYIRKGGAVYIRWRWPWPLRKPFERASIRLYSLGGGVGDELMCTPIFREIRRRNPQCRITYLSRYPEMFRSNPNVDAVEPYAVDALRGAVQLSYLPVLPPPRPLITLMAEGVGRVVLQRELLLDVADGRLAGCRLDGLKGGLARRDFIATDHDRASQSVIAQDIASARVGSQHG